VTLILLKCSGFIAYFTPATFTVKYSKTACYRQDSSFVQSPIWILAIDPCVMMPHHGHASSAIGGPERRQYRTMFKRCSPGRWT